MKLMYWQANPDEEDHRRESRVRENRMHGSEGGEDFGPSRPLSPMRAGRVLGITNRRFSAADPWPTGPRSFLDSA